MFLIRGQKVMLRHDLAGLYGVETRALVRAVKRNFDRFPGDFMFHLTWEESRRVGVRSMDEGATTNSRSRAVILSWGKNIKYRPYAFTEQGYDAQFRAVFDAIRKLMAPPERPRPRIGFRPGS